MMNINGFTRGLMAHNYNSEKYLLHVAGCVERQLIEWDPQYEMLVMKFKNYEIVIKNVERDYHLQISEEEAASLQKISPFKLDQKIWRELEKQGLEISKGNGNYLDTILS
ncbi:hypothetical protein [Neobacillus mesonae]|uniref:hypothetical protein n=1 Tax=Neobacillus mesonae TaxID=1193713 RepID=UPI002040AE33|nr:hypothetical protein [Neobacillus mesonae]MCM3571430.1 hypothetical protein [Neobacillus mesonae]